MAKVSKQPSTWLCPIPAVMVSCQKEGIRPNIITIAWAGTVCSNPPMVGIGIAPPRYSHSIIKESGEFVVNIPRASQVWETDYCGTVSGRERDKFTDCKFSPSPADKVSVPLIAECPLNLECVVKEVVSLGSHDLFIGEIVAIHCDEDVLEHGRISMKKLNPLVYGAGQYWNLGEVLSHHGYSVREKKV